MPSARLEMSRVLCLDDGVLPEAMFWLRLTGFAGASAAEVRQSAVEVVSDIIGDDIEFDVNGVVDVAYHALAELRLPAEVMAPGDEREGYVALTF